MPAEWLVDIEAKCGFFRFASISERAVRVDNTKRTTTIAMKPARVKDMV
ncbi:hypothetical protein HNQ77_000377 [Silvibacterium bohemicum]|uniref:Uncharacterized protein n=1 Tax=Silvibacterium bohemicum TaxID=1577686 RepID=A0A841JRN3_9BACT|nr:hypothetical protein [Silvibacterium bohemicum]